MKVVAIPVALVAVALLAPRSEAGELLESEPPSCEFFIAMRAQLNYRILNPGPALMRL